MTNAVFEDGVDHMEQYVRTLLRGYYKLATILTITIGLIILAAIGVKMLWAVPARPVVDGVGSEVPADNDAVDALRAAFEVENKYRVHNAKLKELVSRGGMSPTVAADAKRDHGIYDRTKDRWSDLHDFEHSASGGAAPMAFNPRVTLSGV